MTIYHYRMERLMPCNYVKQNFTSEKIILDILLLIVLIWMRDRSTTAVFQTMITHDLEISATRRITDFDPINIRRP